MSSVVMWVALLRRFASGNLCSACAGSCRARSCWWSPASAKDHEPLAMRSRLFARDAWCSGAGQPRNDAGSCSPRCGERAWRPPGPTSSICDRRRPAPRSRVARRPSPDRPSPDRPSRNGSCSSSRSPFSALGWRVFSTPTSRRRCGSGRGSRSGECPVVPCFVAQVAHAVPSSCGDLGAAKEELPVPPVCWLARTGRSTETPAVWWSTAITARVAALA